MLCGIWCPSPLRHRNRNRNPLPAIALFVVIYISLGDLIAAIVSQHEKLTEKKKNIQVRVDGLVIARGCRQFAYTLKNVI